MANQKFNQFSGVSSLNNADFLVGYHSGETYYIRISGGDILKSDVITNNSNVNGQYVTQALNALAVATGVLNSGGSQTGSVVSVFGRGGAVSAVSGDYGTTKITNQSTIAGDNLTQTLNNLSGDSVYSQASAGEVTAGTGTEIRKYTPLQIKQFVEAHESAASVAIVTGSNGSMYRSSADPVQNTMGIEAVNFQTNASGVNYNNGLRSFVGNGYNNRGIANYATILNGSNNVINMTGLNHFYSLIGNGTKNEITLDLEGGGLVGASTILNGSNNKIVGGDYETVVNGFNNLISGGFLSVILNGVNVTNTHPNCTVIKGNNVSTDWGGETIKNGGRTSDDTFKTSNSMLYSEEGGYLKVRVDGSSSINMTNDAAIKIDGDQTVAMYGKILARDVATDEAVFWDVNVVARTSSATTTLAHTGLTRVFDDSGLTSLGNPTFSTSFNEIRINCPTIGGKNVIYVADFDFITIK